MTTITSDTSVMDILGGGSSAKFFGLLEDNNELMEDMDDRDELAFKRQERVANEMESMSSSVGQYQENIKASFSQTATKLKDGIVNPLNNMRDESITAYTNFTESIHTMRDSVAQKLSDVKEGIKSKLSEVKEGFSNNVENLKTGFTDAVNSTNEFLDTMSVKMEAFKDLPTEQQIMLASKVVADGVMDTISAIPNAISYGMEKLDKGLTAVGGFMKSSSGYLKGLFQKSEESEDVGRTSGVSDTGKKPDSKDNAGGGIGTLLGKLVPSGLLVSLGKVGKLAGKLALPLVAIMGIFDFVGGIKNAEDIIGKPADQLSALEKAGAGLASVVSGLTLGFIDAKTIYSEGAQVVDSVSGFAKDMFSKLPNSIQEGLSKASDVLFSSKTGIFASVGRMFGEGIEAIENGDYGKLLLNVITSPLQLLFSSDGILANTFNGVMKILPDSFKNSISGFVDTITGWFDKIKNLASDMIPDSLKSLIGGTLSSDIGRKASETVGKGISSVKGFFGYGNEKEETKIVQRKSISDFTDKKDKQGFKKTNSNTSSAIVVKANRDSPEPLINENKANVKTLTKERRVNTVVKRIKDSDTATKKSKEILNRKQDIQPVIIQQPAPIVRSIGSGKQLNTSTSIGDTELAVMNSNMMD